MTIGPSLPPHLAKRSRDKDDDGSSSPDGSEKRRRVLGPAPPSKPSPPRVAGPSLPPQSRSRSSSPDSDVGPAPLGASKPTRVLGPAPPPASLDERPPHPPSDDSDSDSSDDDFGPAPPPPPGTHDAYNQNKPAAKSAFDTDPQYVEEANKVQRDEWMTLPPTSGDLSRIDPSKMRARKFNSGKGASNKSAPDMGIWTETPEQKLKRLQDEAMGITAPSNSSASTKESRRTKREEEQARKMREKIEASRGPSLVDQHKEKVGKDKEDDPSKRGFDYEKDMGIGSNISNKQRREMLTKAKGFSDKFSSGNFL